MSILTFYKGKIGETGKDGEDGLGVEDVDQTLIDSPVLDILHNNNLSNTGDINWNRSGEALIRDRYGDFKFISGDDITNFVEYSNDFTQWLDFGPNAWSIASTGNPDPDGGNNATYIQLDLDRVSGQSCVETVLTGLDNGKFYTVSFDFAVISGTITGLEVNVGSQAFPVKADLTSSFQRVKVSLAVDSSSAALSITPIGLSGSVVSIYEVMYENGSVAHDVVPTNGAIQTISNPLSPSRSNNLGYLIEDQKENLIIFSEDLTQANHDISGATVSTYAGEGPFGDFFQRTQLNWGGTPTATIRSSQTFTQGDTYTVSIFAFLSTGTLTSITASVGGGETLSLGDISSTGFVRLSVQLDAGAEDDLLITMISPDLTAKPIITGIQVENGDLSSYTRNAAKENTRPEDDVNKAYDTVSPSEPWCIAYLQNEIRNNEDNKYIFSNGQSGSNEFSILYSSSNITINIGGSLSVFDANFNAESICFDYDGNDIYMYEEGFFVDSKPNSGQVDNVGTTFYVGSDETSANSINAYLSNLRMWDKNLGANNIRYATGV